MDIGEAIKAMRLGVRVRRAGWSGKGMWIALMPSLNLLPHASAAPGPKVNERTAKYIGIHTALDCQPYIAMWTAAGQWQPGWVASHADLLAEDWEIFDGGQPALETVEALDEAS